MLLALIMANKKRTCILLSHCCPLTAAVTWEGEKTPFGVASGSLHCLRSPSSSMEESAAESCPSNASYMSWCLQRTARMLLALAMTLQPFGVVQILRTSPGHWKRSNFEPCNPRAGAVASLSTASSFQETAYHSTTIH